MDTMYQRNEPREQGLRQGVFRQSRKRHDGGLPLIGVNMFLPKEHAEDTVTEIELIRSTEEEKGAQIKNVEAFRANRNGFAPDSLKVLQQAARDRKSVFAQLMEAVKYNSEGQISHALYEVGRVSGEYVIETPARLVVTAIPSKLRTPWLATSLASRRTCSIVFSGGPTRGYLRDLIDSVLCVSDFPPQG